MGVHVKVAGAWQEIGVAAGGVPWAKVSGGTVTTVNNADGSVDEVHTFTANGSLTVESPGYARVLLVSGGGGYNSSAGGGGGGDVVDGIRSLPAGAVPVVVSTGGVQGGDEFAVTGSPSSLGALSTGRSRRASMTDKSTAASHPARVQPFTSDISGTSRTYAGQANDAPSSTTYGDGSGQNANGKPGVVIVRVQKTAPTVSGVAATGGTETTYTGDGTNGVLGQKYKVHTFTASGSLVVAQGGVCDVLAVGPGSYTPVGAGQSMGGAVVQSRLVLSAGTFTAHVAPVTAQSGDDTYLSIGGLREAVIVAAAGIATANVHRGAAQRNGDWSGSPDGRRSSISGTDLGYGGAYGSTGFGWVNVSTEPRANSGAAGRADNANGAAGVVIVRYEIA